MNVPSLVPLSQALMVHSDDRRRGFITLRVPKELKERLANDAQEKRLSLSDHIRNLLVRGGQ